MVSNTDVEEGKLSTTFAGNDERKSSESKTSLDKLYDEKLDEVADTKFPTSLPCKQNLKAGSTPIEVVDSEDDMKPNPPAIDTVEQKESFDKINGTKLETSPEDKKAKKEDNQKREEAKEVKGGGKPEKGAPDQEQIPGSVPAETCGEESEVQKKSPTTSKPSATSVAVPGGKMVSGIGKVGRSRGDSPHKRPSEIPKLKSLPKAARGPQPKPRAFQSKLPVKTTEKESGGQQGENALDNLKNKPDSMKVMVKSFNVKKESKANDKIKQAMAEDFGYLVPLYEKEFKRISDVWVNTIYCSLTMRTNLVKLLFQAFPNINRTQFHTEDERLLHCIAHAKSCTKLEAENLIKFIKNLVASREKAKEDYAIMTANKEIADCYNHDWRKLIRKMTGLGEEAKHLQMETPELQKKKEVNEINTNEKIRRMEINLCKKEDDIKKLVNQLNLLKQKENSYKDNVLLKIPDYKEIKADVQSLIAVQKEYEELKAKYLFQNYTYEKKIKDLENLVEEKRKVLEREREMKKQLQTLLVQLQAHQKRLTTTIGREQVDYVMGRSLQDRRKRREQLWLAAVKLVLRGFLIQMRRLERDRNKMLLEVQSNNLENFTDPAHIIQKDNFIKSIKQQMTDLQKVCKCPNMKSPQC